MNDEIGKIYDAVLSVKNDLSVVANTVNETKTDIAILKIIVHEKGTIRDTKLNDHENRIRSAEKNQWKAAGAIALLHVIGVGTILGWINHQATADAKPITKALVK